MKRNLWPTRDPVRDYFPLPKEIFSMGLSAAEIAIYVYQEPERGTPPPKTKSDKPKEPER